MAKYFIAMGDAPVGKGAALKRRRETSMFKALLSLDG
jgi:hypothetical protein